MQFTRGLCQEMQRLMQNYTEAVLAHSELARIDRIGNSPNQTAGALLAREGAWNAWESHVADHGCHWSNDESEE